VNTKRTSVLVCLTLTCLLSAAQVKNKGENSGILRAGFASADITPSLPVKLYGYASRKTYSEGIHDPLSVRVAAFENNGNKIILVSTDISSNWGNRSFSSQQFIHTVHPF
jgi:hypothetical protein